MEQKRLFDTPEPAADTRHPGQLSYPDWLKRGDTVYHSSFRSDWEDAPMAHTGSQVAASDRLVQSAQNIAPSATDDPRGGRTWARRVSQPLAHVSTSDAELNAAEWDILAKRAPRTPDPSARDYKSDLNIATMRGHLEAGRPVGYKNSFEDTGSTSVLAPKGSLRAWHQDVSEAQGMGLDVHPQHVALASQQFDPAIAITPKSMAHNVKDYKSRPMAVDQYQQNYPANQQQTMFPASVGEGKHEVLFGIQPRDADRDPWGTQQPGQGAMNRASLYAKESGEKLGFGVRPIRGYDLDAQRAEANRSMEGQERMERAHHTAIDAKRRDLYYGKG